MKIRLYENNIAATSAVLHQVTRISFR